MCDATHIRQAQPHNLVQVQFTDGRAFEGPKGSQLCDFVDAAFPNPPQPIVAALVDDRLTELSTTLDRDVVVRPLDTSANDGMRIYQRAMAYVLIVAVHELYPQARVIIDHSVTLGGFYCQVDGLSLLTPEIVSNIERRMREIVAAAEPITKERIPLAQAKELFASQGYDDKLRLLEHLSRADVAVYSLRGVRNYFYGYMPPSTRDLHWFALEQCPNGVILRLPGRRHPVTVAAHRDYPKLMGVFREYGRWLRILGMSDIGALNAAVGTPKMREAILVSEALHEKHISDIADAIVAHKDQVRVILIAGPSSSGKTTFSKRLAVQLLVNGIRPQAIGLDDYFVDRRLTPRDDNGEYDFESLHAINVPLFNEQLAALMRGDTVQVPHYNFLTGESEPGAILSLPKDSVIIVEGIHGLNPDLVPELPEDSLYRVYASALAQLNIDHHNRVPTADIRLLRRIVRDAAYRGYSAQETIQRWESVRRGEESNIFPYQENADVMFNSALVYELAVLKPFAEPLLLAVPRGTIESTEARRLLAFLQWVLPCEPDLVPDNSLLREFIGGSILRDFQI